MHPGRILDASWAPWAQPARILDASWAPWSHPWTNARRILGTLGTHLTHPGHMLDASWAPWAPICHPFAATFDLKSKMQFRIHETAIRWPSAEVHGRKVPFHVHKTAIRRQVRGRKVAFRVHETAICRRSAEVHGRKVAFRVHETMGTTKMTIWRARNDRSGSGLAA